MNKIKILICGFFIFFSSCCGIGFQSIPISDSNNSSQKRFSKKEYAIVFNGSANSLTYYEKESYLNKKENWFFIFIGSLKEELDLLPIKPDKIYSEFYNGDNCIVYKYCFDRYFGSTEYVKLYIQEGKVVKMDIYYFTG